MVKGFGLILLVLCGAGIGWLAAMRVRQERFSLERLCQMLRAFSVQMEFRADTVEELFEMLCAESAYAMFSFPRIILDHLSRGVSLSEAWRIGLTADGAVPEMAKEQLLPLGDELGASDIIGQVETLAQYRSRLEAQAAQQSTRAATLQRLYLSMGTLAGMMAAILLC